MKELWAALVLLFKDFPAFIAGWMIKRANDNARESKDRADALRSLVAAKNKVAAMSDADVKRLLDEQWDNPKQRL